MPLRQTASICLVLRSKEEIDFFTRVLKRIGLNSVTSFTDAKEAYELAIRQQFDLFIIRMETEPMPGIVLIQKMRATGNYGHEVQFFLADKINEKIAQALAELDIPYVLVKPFTPDRIEQKIKHLFKSENSLSTEEQAIRDAHMALNNKMVEMAEDMANGLKSDKMSEKLLILLSDIYVAKGDRETARRFLEEALVKNPTSAAAVNKLAHTYMEENDFAKAVNLFSRLGELNPYNVSLLENAGLSNFEVGNYEQAEVIMDQLQVLDQTNENSASVLASIAAIKGDFDAMVKHAADAKDSKEMISMLNSQAVEISKTDARKAVEMYKRALSVLAGNAFAYAIYYNMALSYKKLQSYNEAIDCLNKAIALKPDFEKASLSLKKLGVEMKRNAIGITETLKDSPDGENTSDGLILDDAS